jgi:PmbA protein
MDLESAIREAMVRLEVQNLDAFEVAGIRERSLCIEARQQRVERFHRSETQGIAIRAIKGGRLGLSATTEISAKAVHQTVQGAIASLQRTTPSEEAVVPAPQKPAAQLEDRGGIPIAEVADAEKIRIALLLESAAYAAEPRVRRVQHPQYEERERTLVVENSHGVSARAVRSVCACELKAVAEDGDKAEGAAEFAFATACDRLDPEEVGRRAARRAVGKLGARQARGGALPVLFEPRAAASLVRLLVRSFCADNVQRGKSMLRGKLSQRCYHPAVTLVDDGLFPDGYASFAFDGEGIPCRRTVLVQDGVVASWLYDGARASRDGVASTGNCIREMVRGFPHIGMTNAFLKAGSQPPESLIRDVRHGMCITDLLGVHTANTVSGDFSLGVEGFVIADGVRGEPVHGMTAAGNLHEVFRQVAALGNDLTFYGAAGAPSVLADGVVLAV